MLIPTLLAGALLLAAGFWPNSVGWTCWFSLAPLYWAGDDRPPREAFALGWLFGAVGWAAGMYWLAPTVGKFLSVPPLVGFALFAGICAWHGLMTGAITAAVSALTPPLARRSGRPALALALVAVSATVAADGWFPAIFPIRFTNTQYFHLPMVQSIDLLGTGLTACLLASFNVALYLALRRRGWRFLAVMVALVGLNEAYGLLRMRAVDAEVRRLLAEGRGLRVAVIQSAIPIWRKSDPGSLAENLGTQAGLTARALESGPADLVIWPETTYGRHLAYRREAGRAVDATLDKEPFAARISKDIPGGAQVLLGALGGPEDETGDGWRYNTAFLKAPGGELLGVVEKRVRMPFGEYFPLGRWLPSFYRWSPRTRKILAGREQRLLTARDGMRLGVLVCYEDLHPDYARAYAALGADLLVNMTNDAWFGKGAAPEQHLRMAALRAIESRRFLLRAVNTGISAVVDPAGRILARIPGERRDVLTETVVPMQLKTLHTSAGRGLYLLSAALLVLFLGLRLREARSS